MSLEINFFGKLGSGLVFSPNRNLESKQGILRDVFDYYKRKNMPGRSMGKNCLSYEEINLANSTLSLSELIGFMKDFSIVPSLLTINGVNFAWQRQRQRVEDHLFKSNRIDFANFVEILARCAVLAFAKSNSSHFDRARQLISFLMLDKPALVKNKLVLLQEAEEIKSKRRPIFIRGAIQKTLRRKWGLKTKKRIQEAYLSFKTEIDLFEQYKPNKLQRRYTLGPRKLKQPLQKMKSFIHRPRQSRKKLFLTRKIRKRRMAKLPQNARLCFLTGTIDSEFSEKCLHVFKEFSWSDKLPSFPWRELSHDEENLNLVVITKREYKVKIKIKNLFESNVFVDFTLENLKSCSIDFDGIARIKGLVITAYLNVCCETPGKEEGSIMVNPKKRDMNGKITCLPSQIIQVTITARNTQVTTLLPSPSDEESFT